MRRLLRLEDLQAAAAAASELKPVAPQAVTLEDRPLRMDGDTVEMFEHTLYERAYKDTAEIIRFMLDERKQNAELPSIIKDINKLMHASKIKYAYKPETKDTILNIVIDHFVKQEPESKSFIETLPLIKNLLDLGIYLPTSCLRQAVHCENDRGDKLIKLLLEYGAKEDARDLMEGSSIFLEAVINPYCKVPILQALAKRTFYHACAMAPTGYNALEIAVASGRSLDVIIFLATLKLNRSAKSRNKQTLHEIATANKHLYRNTDEYNKVITFLEDIIPAATRYSAGFLDRPLPPTRVHRAESTLRVDVERSRSSSPSGRDRK